MNIVQFYKNKAFKISLIVIINLWSLLFILDYLATRKKSNFIYNGVITKAYNVKRSSSILHFIKLENNTMPIDLADVLEIKIGENITSSIGFFTNIVFSISYLDNNVIIKIYPNSGIVAHYIFLPLFCILLFIFELIFFNSEDFIKFLTMNVIFVMIQFIIFFMI